MDELKPQWDKVEFGEVVRLISNRCDPAEEGIERYVGLEHIEPGDLRIASWGNVVEGTTFTSRFLPGQVLFGKRRAYQRKVAVADFEGVCSGDIYVFESADPTRLIPELLPFLCQTDAFFRHATGTSAGSLSPRTNWESLARYEFALPSICEQQRAVDFLSAADRMAVECREASEAGLTAWKSLAEYLISGLGDEHHIRIRDACYEERPLCYGVVQPGRSVVDGVPMIRVCDITDDQAIHPKSDLTKISASVDGQYTRSRLAEGDVLVSVVGTIGRVAVAGAEHHGYNVARAIARISPRPDLDPEYLAAVLRSPQYQRQLTVEAFETARKTLNLSVLGEVLIPLPSMERQRSIVARLAQIERARRSALTRAASARQLMRIALDEWGRDV